jgi:hypothetical protein
MIPGPAGSARGAVCRRRNRRGKSISESAKSVIGCRANGHDCIGAVGCPGGLSCAPRATTRDPDFPVASQVLAAPGKAVNAMINAPFSLYNNWVTNTQQLNLAARVSDPALAQQINDAAYINMSVQTLDGVYHGDSQIVQKGINLVDKANAANQHQLAQTLQGTLDCPPKSASFHIDPSGTVKTTTGIPVAGAKVVLSRSSTAKGKQKQVPNGSDIMSVSNRRNPDHTSAAGVFHWDVFPGYYQIKASYPGCRAAKGNSLFGLTPVLAVPPPRYNLRIALRCKNYMRRASELRLRLGSKGELGGLIVATVTYTRGRKVPAADLPGDVTFKVAGAKPLTVPVIVSHGWAFYDLPLTKKKIRSVSASFSGNGDLAPSSVRLKNP